MEYPSFDIEPTNTPQVGINIFGSDNFKDYVLMAIADKTILMKETIGPTPYACVEINGRNMGRVWMDLEVEKEPLLCIIENAGAKDDQAFPWEFQHGQEFNHDPQLRTSNTLSMFKHFTDFVERLQYGLPELFREKCPGYKEETYIPPSIYTLLDYDYFRMICELVTSIDVGVAFVEGTLGTYAYVMTKASSEDHDIKLCSVLKLTGQAL